MMLLFCYLAYVVADIQTKVGQLAAALPMQVGAPSYSYVEGSYVVRDSLVRVVEPPPLPSDVFKPNIWQ